MHNCSKRGDVKPAVSVFATGRTASEVRSPRCTLDTVGALNKCSWQQSETAFFTLSLSINDVSGQ